MQIMDLRKILDKPSMRYRYIRLTNSILTPNGVNAFVSHRLMLDLARGMV